MAAKDPVKVKLEAGIQDILAKVDAAIRDVDPSYAASDKAGSLSISQPAATAPVYQPSRTNHGTSDAPLTSPELAQRPPRKTLSPPMPVQTHGALGRAKCSTARPSRLPQPSEKVKRPATSKLPQPSAGPTCISKHTADPPLLKAPVAKKAAAAKKPKLSAQTDASSTLSPSAGKKSEGAVRGGSVGSPPASKGSKTYFGERISMWREDPITAGNTGSSTARSEYNNNIPEYDAAALGAASPPYASHKLSEELLLLGDSAMMGEELLWPPGTPTASQPPISSSPQRQYSPPASAATSRLTATVHQKEQLASGAEAHTDLVKQLDRANSDKAATEAALQAERNEFEQVFQQTEDLLELQRQEFTAKQDSWEREKQQMAQQLQQATTQRPPHTGSPYSGSRSDAAAPKTPTKEPIVRLPAARASTAAQFQPSSGQPDEKGRRLVRLRAAFGLIDKDSNGMVTRAELIKSLRQHKEVRLLLGLDTFRQGSEGHVQFEHKFQTMDKDQSRDVSLEEFVAVLEQEDSHSQQPRSPAAAASGSPSTAHPQLSLQCESSISKSGVRGPDAVGDVTQGGSSQAAIVEGTWPAAPCTSDASRLDPLREASTVEPFEASTPPSAAKLSRAAAVESILVNLTQMDLRLAQREEHSAGVGSTTAAVGSPMDGERGLVRAKAAFGLIDKANNGSVSRAELVQALRSNREVRLLLGLADSDGQQLERTFKGSERDLSCAVSVEEFVAVVGARVQASRCEELNRAKGSSWSIMAALANESPNESPAASPVRGAAISHAQRATVQAQEALRDLQQRELRIALDSQREWQLKAEQAEERAAAIAAAMEALPAELELLSSLESKVADEAKVAAEARQAVQRAEDDVLNRLQETARLEAEIQTQLSADADEALQAPDANRSSFLEVDVLGSKQPASNRREAQGAFDTSRIQRHSGAHQEGGNLQSFAEAMALVQQHAEQDAAKQTNEKRALVEMNAWRKEVQTDRAEAALCSGSITELVGKLERMRQQGSPVATNILGGGYGLPIVGLGSPLRGAPGVGSPLHGPGAGQERSLSPGFCVEAAARAEAAARGDAMSAVFEALKTQHRVAMNKLDIVQQRMIFGNPLSGSPITSPPSMADPRVDPRVGLNLAEPPERYFAPHRAVHSPHRAVHSPPAAHSVGPAHGVGSRVLQDSYEGRMQDMIRSTQRKTAAALRAAEVAQRQAEHSYRSVFLGTNHFEEQTTTNKADSRVGQGTLFDQTDPNGDGVISRDEWSGWQHNSRSRTSYPDDPYDKVAEINRKLIRKSRREVERSKTFLNRLPKPAKRL